MARFGVRRGAWAARGVVLGLLSELDTAGGVPRAGRHVAAVMSEFAAGHGMDCRVLSLNDSPELHRITVGAREFVFTGSARGKARFSATAARAARRRAKLIVSGHPFLAPVAQGANLFAQHATSIVWTHGLEVWEPLSILRRHALRRADLIIAPTKDTANQVAGQQDVP